MNFTNAEQIANSSAIVFFFLFLFLGLLLLTVFAGFDFKLIKMQAKEIDKYMKPLVEAKTLSTLSNYREAAKQKSIYLYFKRSFIPVSILLGLTIIYAFYIPFGFKGYTLDSVAQSPISIWWIQTTFGMVPARVQSSLGGMNLIYGFYSSPLYEQIPLAMRVFTVLLNSITFLALLLFLYQTQGYVARFIRIFTRKEIDVIPILKKESKEDGSTEEKKNVATTVNNVPATSNMPSNNSSSSNTNQTPNS